MTESLKKCYKEVADAFDEYVNNKGISEEILTKAQIEQYLRDKEVVIDTFFLPSDMCYNHTTKPMGSDDEFETTPRLFEYVGRNKYRVLGTKYSYTGKIVRKSKNNGEFVVGEWINGELIKLDKEKVLE